MSDLYPVGLTMSESVGKLMPALLKAQKAMKAVARDAANPFFNSRYASLEAVLDAVKPALNEQGIVLLQGADLVGNVLSVWSLAVHESGEWVRAGAPFGVDVPGPPQGYGSVLSYGRRYSLRALFALADEDDDANAAQGAHERARADRQQEKLAAAKQNKNSALKAFWAKWDEVAKAVVMSETVTPEWVREAGHRAFLKRVTTTPAWETRYADFGYGAESFDDLSAEQVAYCVGVLKERVAEVAKWLSEGAPESA